MIDPRAGLPPQLERFDGPRVQVIKTSAKIGENVEAAFDALASPRS